MAWIKTKAWFRDSEISDAEWEIYSDEQKNQNAHLADYRFDSDEVCNYNERSDGLGITLIFKNRDSAMIQMSIEEADKIFFKK